MSTNKKTSELTDAERELFEKPNFASLATTCPTGHPQVSTIWIDVDGNDILVNTAHGRVKDNNMKRDPRVAICVYDKDNPYRMVTVQGTVVERTTEGAEDHIDKMAQKYLGNDYPAHGDRVLFRVRPERVATMGF